MNSMTGYGAARYSEGGIDLTVEIKTVNNRVLDLNVKAPRAFAALEDKIRKVVSENVKRGRADLFVTFSDKRETAIGVTVDTEKALKYYTAGKELAEKLGVENDVTPAFLIRLPDVIESAANTDLSDIETAVTDTVRKACENLNAMRKAEGAKLVADMLSRMVEISEIREKITLRAPNVAAEYKEKLKSRIEEALKGVKYDEARLLNEVAFYTDKVNIDEELTRLGSHINQFRAIVNTENAGKKLDFLMQEFNREANTICSKSNDVEVTRLALSLKNEIEKVREQVQNLE